MRRIALLSDEVGVSRLSNIRGGAAASGAPVTVTSVNVFLSATDLPPQGTKAGGFALRIKGTNFSGTPPVLVDGVAASNVVVDNATTLRCTCPAIATAGLKAVSVAGVALAASFESIDMAAASWAFWHRPPYVPPPPVPGVASNGASGGRTATSSGSTAFDPTAGSTVNGKVPMLFTASNSSYLVADANPDILFPPASGGSGWFFVFPIGALPATGGQPYTDGTLYSDAGDGEYNIGMIDAGIKASIYTAAGHVPVVGEVPAVGAWNLVQWRHDNVTLQVRLNGHAWTSVACGPYTPLAPAGPRFGQTYAGGMYLNGAIAEMAGAAGTMPDVVAARVLAYVRTTYLQALP